MYNCLLGRVRVRALFPLSAFAPFAAAPSLLGLRVLAFFFFPLVPEPPCVCVCACAFVCLFAPCACVRVLLRS